MKPFPMRVHYSAICLWSGIWGFFLCCVGAIYAEPISGTGWSEDVIIEAAAADPLAATSRGYTLLGYVLVEEGYAGPGAGGVGVPLPVSDGIVISQSGNTYLVDTAGNNTILDSNEAGEGNGFTNTLEGTFTLSKPRCYMNLSFFLTGIGGNGVDTNFLAKVKFTDTSHTDLIGQVKDWQSSTTYNMFTNKSAHIQRGDTSQSNSYWLRELSFTLSDSDQSKKIEAIEFYLDQRLGVSGVSGAPLPDQVIINDIGTWTGTAADEAVVPDFDASASDMLLLCISGEHGFSGAIADITNVTYNGVLLTQAVDRDNRVDAYGPGAPDQSFNDIWYLNKPGAASSTNGPIQVWTGSDPRVIITAFALSNTRSGIGSIAISEPDSKSLQLAVTKRGSLVIASHALGGDGNTGGVSDVDPVAPLAETSAVVQGQLYNGQLTGVSQAEAVGPTSYSFTGGATIGSNVVAIEILPPPPKGMLIQLF
jgi:hypothetical protein